MEKKYYTSERNIQILIALLKANGIKRVVASPGATNITFVASLQQDHFFNLYSCVDERSAAYMARRIAVDYLRERKAHEVLVRLAYAIGYAEPLEKTVIIDGEPEEIKGYDLTPNGIIKYLDLKRPIYEKTACYGHYGEGFDWDK